MSTRSEMLKRHELAQAARDRVKSGQYLGNKYEAQQAAEQPQLSTRQRLLSSYVPPVQEKEPIKAGPFTPIPEFKPQSEMPSYMQAKPSGIGPAIQQYNKDNNVKTVKPLPGRDIPVVGWGLQQLDKLQKFTEPAAKIAEEYYTPGAGLAAMGAFRGAGEALLGKVAPKIAQGAGIGARAAKEAILEGSMGVPLGGGQALARHPEDLKGVGIGAASGALVGAGGGMIGSVVGPALGKAFGKLFKRNGIPDEQVQEILALPMGREDAARMARAPQNGTEPIVTPYTFGLPEPQVGPATTGRVAQQANPYRQQFESLMQRAQKMQAEGQFTPGREEEELASLWSQMAGREAPSLDELINLAYKPRPNKVTPDLVQRAQSSQYAREVAGAPLPVRSMADRYPQGALAEAAPIEQKLARADVVPPGVAQQRPRVDVTPPAEVPAPAPAAPKSTRAKMLADYETAQKSATPPGMKQRGLVGNLEQSGKLNARTMNAIRRNPEANYQPIRNADTVEAANARVNKDTLESEKGYIMSKGQKGDYLSTEDIATGFRLLDEYKAVGDVESASQIALKLAQTATRNGQAVQINAIYSKLSPEGVLKVASKVFNEGVSDIKAQKPLPPEMATQIMDAAEALQKASGMQSLSKQAITIFEKARTGQALTEQEVKTLKGFTEEAKKLLPPDKARTPRAAADPNARVVDKVKKASASAAEKARERIKARRNRLSANPLDEWKDYAIVGFDHMMTGAVKFADFASKMRGEFGNSADEVMDKVYINAYGKFRRANKIPQSEFETMTNKALSGEDISDVDAGKLRVMAIELSQLSGAAKDEAMADLQVAFNAMKEGTRGKKAASVLRSVQLGNARTILRNEISNNAFYLLDTVRRKYIATPIDIVSSTISGRNREIFFKNGPQGWTDYFKDWATGYKMGRRGLNPGGLQSQYDLGTLAFNPQSTKIIDKVGSFMERNVGAFMKAGDYAASNRAISNEMGQLAQAKAHAEGFRGKNLARKAEEYFHTADTKMAEQAQKYGEYMTFQDKNFLSSAAVALRDKVLNFNQDFGLGNVVINYPKTPANILMRAIDYSPLGFVKFMGMMGKNVFKGDVPKKDFIDTFTRALAGTGIAGMGLYLSKLGMLNVLPSKDIGVSELERKAGKIPNSLNITALKRYVTSFGDEAAAKPKQGDTYASVDWFQPLAIPMAVGAAAGQSGSATRLNTGVNAASAAGQSLDAAMESFGNMSVYRNIKDLVGNNYTTASQKAAKLAANTVSMFTPAIVGQVRNVVDPKLRDTGTKSGFVGAMKGQLMNRVPGLSAKLPESVDTFGDTKQSDYGLGTRALNAFLNPSLVDQYTPTKEAKAVLDLIERTGQKSLAPNKPQRSMTYKSESYGFSPEEYREYQKLTGQFVTENLAKAQEYLDNPVKTDAQRIKKIEAELTDAGDKAKKEMRKRMGIK